MAVRWADAEPDSGRDAARVCSFPRGFASRLAQGHPPLPRLPALVMQGREKMSGKLPLGHRNKVAGNSSGSGLARPTPRTSILLLRGHSPPARASERPGRWAVWSLVSLKRGAAAVHAASRTNNNTLCTKSNGLLTMRQGVWVEG